MRTYACPLAASCRHQRYGAHGSDRGFNGIFLSHASNVWVSQVQILNADNGVIASHVDRATLQDVVVGSTESRAAPADETLARQGHHAILLAASQDVLVSG